MPVVALLVAVAAAPWFAGQFLLHLTIMVCINIVIVNGLSIIDRAGQLSFGHSASVAIGAYATALITEKLSVGVALSAFLAIFVAALITAILGLIILRLRGVYFVLVTFAFAEVMRLLLLDNSNFTGGASGIAGIAPVSLWNFSFDTRGRMVELALFAAVVSSLLVWHIFRNPLGWAMECVAINSGLAESTGLSARKLQLTAFVIGCSLAALGGVLQARYIGFISPDSFGTSISVGFLTMLVIGGRRSLWGPIVGAVVVTPLPELFRSAVQMQNIFYGAVLILILCLMPGGLVEVGKWMQRGIK